MISNAAGDQGASSMSADRGHSPSFSDIYVATQLGAAAINSVTADGHSYADHNPIGAHGVHGYDHISYADALAAALFISAAMDYGHATQLSGFSTGYVGPGPGSEAIQPKDASSYADQARPVNLPGIARDRKAITALKWPHGKCDPRSEIRRAAAELALSPYFDTVNSNPSGAISLRGIRRIPTRWPHAGHGAFKPDAYANIIEGGGSWWDQVAPTVSAKDPSRCPNGWYQGVNGNTQFWREFYQIHPSASKAIATSAIIGAIAGMLLLHSLTGGVVGSAVGAGIGWKLGTPKFDDWRTYLMVAGATWHYTRPDDYETLVAFSVISWPFVQNGNWTYDWREIRAHRGYGEQLVQAVAKYLDAHPALPDAQAFRRELGRAALPAGTQGAGGM
jgi:hypothetical protein